MILLVCIHEVWVLKIQSYPAESKVRSVGLFLLRLNHGIRIIKTNKIIVKKQKKNVCFFVYFIFLFFSNKSFGLMSQDNLNMKIKSCKLSAANVHTREIV